MHVDIHPLQTRLVLTALFAGCVVTEFQITARAALL